MSLQKLRYYLFNCFLLTLPVMIWNVAFTSRLPAVFGETIFWKDIPTFLSWGENASRILVFVLAGLMPLQLKEPHQRRGLMVYTLGIAVYFTSWLALICWPDSIWSTSLAGFMAPALTPALWLGGIAVTGKSFYPGVPFRPWIFPLTAVIFLGFHNAHAVLVYCRIH